MSDTVKVTVLPRCKMGDLARVPHERRAKYDAKTILGPWAHMCEECYQSYRYYTSLGTGKGQRLELIEPKTKA